MLVSELNTDCSFIWIRTASSALDACAAPKPVEFVKAKIAAFRFLFIYWLIDCQLWTSRSPLSFSSFSLFLQHCWVYYVLSSSVSAALLHSSCVCYLLWFNCPQKPSSFPDSPSHLSLQILQVTDFPFSICSFPGSCMTHDHGVQVISTCTHW